MQQIPTLIIDLAVILTYAGIFTLLFKRLKQPLVLGYIVAGFLATKYIPFTPDVSDSTNVKIWADIGVIFLLFALGLEFSFKKIIKVGNVAMIATCTVVFFMILCGIAVGYACGWKQMDCLFLGGMIAMSSTTIIYKALEDLGLQHQKFAGLVLSILVLEDVLAIVLMVMLSTVAVQHHFEGDEMLFSLGKLFFFLVLWFVVGIYLIPGFFRRYRTFMSDEILLVVSLGFCFIMVYVASLAGFSPAFGAFIMGSILAETIDGDKIARLVTPVKDLFGAIFFVSVGMMVDPVMIVHYALPIAIITLAVIIGQAFFGTLGVLLSGQSLKTAIQCGFSLTQIGEFSFIIATLGVTLGVTSSFLYPVVVAVSVITTFLTPYIIRMAIPAYSHVSRWLPVSWMVVLDRADSGNPVVATKNTWKELLISVIRMVLIYSIIVIAILLLCLQFLSPILQAFLNPLGGNILSAGLIIIVCAPFLRAIAMKKNHSAELRSLWARKRSDRILLFLLLLVKMGVVVLFLALIVKQFTPLGIGWVFGIAILCLIGMISCRYLKKKSIQMERKFFHNFRMKENYMFSYDLSRKPSYAGSLLAHDLHQTEITLPPETSWAGKALNELNLSKLYGIHIASILRGGRRINIPQAHERIFPQDTLQVIGTDESLAKFCQEMKHSMQANTAVDNPDVSMSLQSIRLHASSPFIGKTVLSGHIRDKFKCLVVGLERDNQSYTTVPVSEPFQQNDVIWVVGEFSDVNRLAYYRKGDRQPESPGQE